MQQVSKAAVVLDARAIRVQIGCLKQRALTRTGGSPHQRRGGVKSPRMRMFERRER